MCRLRVTCPISGSIAQSAHKCENTAKRGGGADTSTTPLIGRLVRLNAESIGDYSGRGGVDGVRAVAQH